MERGGADSMSIVATLVYIPGHLWGENLSQNMKPRYRRSPLPRIFASASAANPKALRGAPTVRVGETARVREASRK